MDAVRWGVESGIRHAAAPMNVSTLGSVTAQEQLGDVGASTASRTSSPGAGDLGPDAFFRLLAAQLRHQDPLEPMRDTAFVAQLAQLTQLEEIRAANRALMGFAALSLLGKEVVAVTQAGEHTGPVTGVMLDPRSPALVVGDTTIPWLEIVALRLAQEPDAAGQPAASGL